MKIEYTEWRNAVRFSANYDSSEIWKEVKNIVKQAIKDKDIRLSIEDFKKISEDTIIDILTSNKATNWTENIIVGECCFRSVSLYEYLQELCYEVEYGILFYNREIVDYGDVITCQREIQ